MRALPLVTFLLGCALLLGACDRRKEPPVAPPGTITYEGRGVLQEVKAGGRKAVIAHENIPGFMEAMTMEFEVEDPGATSQLVRGDEVAFRVVVGETHGWIDRVRKTGHISLPALPETPVRIGEVGSPLTDAELVDQGGRHFRLSDFKGRALALTFIYTNCPFPDFCPRMSEQFSAAQRALAAAGDDCWNLLSISIDPERDTPGRLAEYAQRYAPDFAHWTFAAGDPAEIQKVANSFGLVVTKEGAQWNHNLRTVVIDPAGRVRKIFSGNEWKPEELVAEMKLAIPAGK